MREVPPRSKVRTRSRKGAWQRVGQPVGRSLVDLAYRKLPNRWRRSRTGRLTMIIGESGEGEQGRTGKKQRRAGFYRPITRFTRVPVRNSCWSPKNVGAGFKPARQPVRTRNRRVQGPNPGRFQTGTYNSAGFKPASTIRPVPNRPPRDFMRKADSPRASNRSTQALP